jgi:hypothetical protein
VPATTAIALSAFKRKEKLPSLNYFGKVPAAYEITRFKNPFTQTAPEYPERKSSASKIPQTGIC